MDRTAGRRPAFRSQPSPPMPVREVFQPTLVRTEDDSNCILVVQLPGFKTDEIRVQVDNTANKLLVKGSRQSADNKYLDVDQSFEVPNNTIMGSITWRFEDGALTFLMPKKVVLDKQRTEIKGALEDEKLEAAEGKNEEEAIKKDTETHEEKNDEPVEEKQNDEATVSKEPQINAEINKEEEPINDKVMRSAEKEEINQKGKAMPDEVKERQNEEKACSAKEINQISDAAKPEERKNKLVGHGGRLDPQSVGGKLLEKIKRNQTLIATAVAAFLAGFFVSHKLKGKTKT